jgi:hypothetical protein
MTPRRIREARELRWIGEKSSQGRGQFARVSGRHENAGIGRHRGRYGTPCTAHDRQPPSQRLGERHTVPFKMRRQHEQPCVIVLCSERLLVECTEQAYSTL